MQIQKLEGNPQSKHSNAPPRKKPVRKAKETLKKTVK
jgi:hypothetical protein